MFHNVAKHCNNLNLKHTFDDTNEGVKVFNSIKIRKILIKISNILVNESKLAVIRPLVDAVKLDDMTVEYKYNSQGIVKSIQVFYQGAHVTFVK